MGFANKVIGGAAALIRAAIKSPNFVHGSAGWSINKDGSAEFNNIVIRNGQVISGTALYYSGAPALGNLVASVSATAGTDSLGNAYKAGVTVYDTAAGTSFLELLAGSPAALNVGTGDAAEATPSQYTAAVSGAGPTRFIQDALRAARVTGQAALAFAQVLLDSPSVDLTTSPAQVVLKASATALISTTLTVTPSGASLAGGPLTADTWHTMTPLGASFAAGAFTPRYRLYPDNTVHFTGQISLTANVAAFTAFFTLPAGYIPAQEQRFATPNNLSGSAAGTASVAIKNTSGFMEVVVAGSTGNIFELDGIVLSLD